MGKKTLLTYPHFPESKVQTTINNHRDSGNLFLQVGKTHPIHSLPFTQRPIIPTSKTKNYSETTSTPHFQTKPHQTNHIILNAETPKHSKITI